VVADGLQQLLPRRGGAHGGLRGGGWGERGRRPRPRAGAPRSAAAPVGWLAGPAQPRLSPGSAPARDPPACRPCGSA
jgi:hypothetical protein